MEHLRRHILIAAICSFLIAIATPLTFSLLVGFSRTVMLSKYREIDINAIDHERIKQMQDGRFASDWGLVAEWLSKGEEDWQTAGWIIGVLWAANGIFLIFLWSQSVPGASTESTSQVPCPNSSPPPTPPYL